MNKEQMLKLSPVIGAYLQTQAVEGKGANIQIGRYWFHLPAYNRTDLWVFTRRGKTVNRIKLPKGRSRRRSV